MPPASPRWLMTPKKWRETLQGKEHRADASRDSRVLRKCPAETQQAAFPPPLGQCAAIGISGEGGRPGNEG